MTEDKRYPAWADMLNMVCHAHEDYVWRIKMEPEGKVVMSYIGYCPVDTPRLIVYSSFEKIPEWVKDRLAVLNMMPPNPTDSAVFGVGRRVDEDTWWVVETAEERLRGTNA